MAFLNIGGKRIRVDDSFLSMSPEQQNAAVDEISQSIGGNADGTFGQPPEGMILDPATGRMMDTKAIAEQQNQGTMGQIGAFGGTAIKGVPIVGEWLDEAVGATMGPVAQGVARERTSQFEENNPKTAFAGKLAAGASAIVPAVMGGASFAAGATTLPRVMAGLGADGGVMGFTAGAGSNNSGGSAERVESGLYGMGTGIATGVALPGIFAGVGKVAKPVVDAVLTPFRKGASIAQSRVAAIAKELKLTPTQIKARLAELGPESMVADTLGAGGHRLARSAANQSPTAQNILGDASAKRMAGQSERIAEALRGGGGLKTQQTPNELVSALRKESQPAISRAYDDATAAGFDMPNEPFRQLKQSSMVKAALKKAKKRVVDRAVANGETAGSQLAVYDQAKKTLDSQAGVAFRKGDKDTGGLSAALAKKLRQTVDDNIPKYGGARELAQTTSKREEAIRMGELLAKPKVSTELTGSPIDDAMQPYVAQGYAGGKSDAVLNRRGTPGAIESQFGSPQQNAALKAALGNKAPVVDRQLDAERVFGQTHNAFGGNSTTAQQINDMGFSGSKGGLIERAFDAVRRNIMASKEADIAPVVAQILAGKDVTGRAFAALERDPVLRNSIVELLGIQANEARAGLTGP